MKRCPKCNRTYSTDTQKFCTHDGGLLFAINAGLGQTMQFDSSKVQDEVAKPTTRDLGEQQPAFDPEATVVTGVDDGTQQIKKRDTGSLEPSQPTQHQMPPSAEVPSESLPSLTSTLSPQSASGPITTSAPLPPTEATPSGPIAPPVAQQAQPSQPLAQPPAKKKSKLPLVLAIVAVIVIFFVGAAAVAAYFLVIKRRQEARRVVATTPSEPTRTNPSVPTTATPSEPSASTNEPPPYNPP